MFGMLKPMPLFLEHLDKEKKAIIFNKEIGC